jgi:hypothetical protein
MVGKERPLKERGYGRKGWKEGAMDLKRAVAQGIKYCQGRQCVQIPSIVPFTFASPPPSDQTRTMGARGFF